MLNSLIFVALPYGALALCCFVIPYRYANRRLTWSAYSTQFLERKVLYWGINPWHYGILPLLLAHLAGFAFPGPLRRLLGNQQVLLLVENLGLALGLLALGGVLLLLLRRANAPMLKRVTYPADWLLLTLLLLQAASGLYLGSVYRWGSQWYLHTAVPYLWSLVSFDPQLGYVAELPPVFKLHAALAFLILGVLPFTKLVHALYWPLDFLKDPPTLYRWRQRESR
jgi:nitrate reductase gamma subunit